MPEPVTLGKEDLGKLKGILGRGEITEEDYEFLLRGRIELNALTPTELLEWLEKRLEELDLWKTVPEQEELDGCMKEQMDSNLEYTRKSLVGELTEAFEDKLGLSKIQDALGRIRGTIEEKIDAEISRHMEDIEYPTKNVEEFNKLLREDMENYWAVLAEEIATLMVAG